jgi:hypothetical protein
MIKRLLLIGVAAIAACALADHILVVGSEGQGTAQSEDGRRGEFRYNVRKASTEGHRPRFDGSLRFAQVATSTHPGLVIEMGRPSYVEVPPDSHVCEFGGPGVLVLRRLNGTREQIRGRVDCRVVDRRFPDHPENPADIFRIRFHAAHGDRTYSFEGLVTHGGLVVFRRRAH